MTDLDKAVFYAVLAAMTAVGGYWLTGERYEAVRWGIFAVAGVCGIVFIFYVGSWLSDTIAKRDYSFQLARATTAATETVRVMGLLSPGAQLELAKLNPIRFAVTGLLGVNGIDRQLHIVYSLKIPGITEGVPLSFLRIFLDRSDHRSLCPVSTWSEGSRYRKYSVALTNYFAQIGYAQKHVGKEASWTIIGQTSAFFMFRDAILNDPLASDEMLLADTEYELAPIAFSAKS